MTKYIPRFVVIDVDGVMTTGTFHYSEKGKIIKVFGAHDNDGLKIIKKFFKIFFVTADKKGFKISKKRIFYDMGFELKLITEKNRYNFIEKKFGFKNTIYMGDGIYDASILKSSNLGICPANARIEAKKNCNHIVKSKSGEGAVLDACIYIMKKFYNKKFQEIIKA